jgi:hypothetical protein
MYRALQIVEQIWNDWWGLSQKDQALSDQHKPNGMA